jgi:hypothetical protein
MDSRSTVDEKSVVLAREQATGLRALADLITRHPDLAVVFRLQLSSIYVPLVSGDVRAQLEEFHRGATAAKVRVTVDNLPDECRVTAQFTDAVVIEMAAKAERMAGESPRPPAPKYAPLSVGGGHVA